MGIEYLSVLLPPRLFLALIISVIQVRGSDEDNLHFTKKAQADLWKHQFSQNCSSPNVKIMMTEWRNISWNGLGSQLHIFSGRLSLAVQHGRVLVMRPGTFEFSQHWGCPKGISLWFYPQTKYS